ncbi:MAG TPA: hypothetical protein VFL82_09055 [Thermomicrobiales bacterium]|nr:hypothetical protein [Thermomicrobiales bacterium]
MRIATEHGELKELVAQYETTIGEHSYPVVRYDNAHGRPHRGLLDWSGETIHKHWLPDNLTLGQALDLGRDDLIANWTRYRLDFLERRPQ